RPSLVVYTVNGETHTKPIDESDKALLERIAHMDEPGDLPLCEFPFSQMWEASRLRDRGITHVHQMFLPRARQSLALMWQLASAHSCVRLRNALLYWVEQAIVGMSVLNRYSPSHFSQVNRALSGA